MEYEPLTDKALLERIATRDAAAFEAFYGRHARVVYNLLMRIVRTPEVADELLQECFWQLWLKAEEYQGSGPAAAWICRIARNKALDYLRRQGARPQAVVTSDEPAERKLWETMSEGEGDILTSVGERIERQRVMRALREIPDEQRLCLELAYFEGMSQSQIATLTGTPLGTIKTRMRMGLQKLERLLRIPDF